MQRDFCRLCSKRSLSDELRGLLRSNRLQPWAMTTGGLGVGGKRHTNSFAETAEDRGSGGGESHRHYKDRAPPQPVKRPSVWPRKFQYPHEVAESLFQNLLYAQNGIFSFAKPLGISCYGAKDATYYWRTAQQGQIEEQPEDSEDEASVSLSVNSSLPALSTLLGSSDPLELITAIPRYASGPVIATSGEKAKKLVQGALSRSRTDTKGNPLCRALALCTGRFDNLMSGPSLCRAKVIEVNGIFMYDVCSEEDYLSFTKKDLKAGAVTQDMVSHRVLGESSGCSLVELTFSSFRRHYPRIFCYKEDAPILGDSVYQPRLARILGQTVFVQPNRASLKNQYVPPELLKAFKLSLREYHKLPMFLHVIGMQLKQLHGKRKEDVWIHNPLPNHFHVALKLLDLRDCIEEIQHQNT